MAKVLTGVVESMGPAQAKGRKVKLTDLVVRSETGAQVRWRSMSAMGPVAAALHPGQTVTLYYSGTYSTLFGVRRTGEAGVFDAPAADGGRTLALALFTFTLGLAMLMLVIPFVLPAWFLGLSLSARAARRSFEADGRGWASLPAVAGELVVRAPKFGRTDIDRMDAEGFHVHGGARYRWSDIRHIHRTNYRMMGVAVYQPVSVYLHGQRHHVSLPNTVDVQNREAALAFFLSHAQGAG